MLGCRHHHQGFDYDAFFRAHADNCMSVMTPEPALRMIGVFHPMYSRLLGFHVNNHHWHLANGPSMRYNSKHELILISTQTYTILRSLFRYTGVEAP